LQDNDSITGLLEVIDTVLNYKESDLISRSEWGEINFQNALHDFDNIYKILKELKDLPLQHLSDRIFSQLHGYITQIQNLFKEINDFHIRQENPIAIRDNLLNQIQKLANDFQEFTIQILPYLAYKRGDLSKNIEQLSNSVEEANKLLESGKKEFNKKSEELDNIVIKAREASAKAGVAVFTKDFYEEAKRLDRNSISWLIATIVLAILTVVYALYSWYNAKSDLEGYQLIQTLGSKAALLAVLFTATFWCGRIYKALRHQSTINRHRSLSLQTFEAFTNATDDLTTKNSVLVEASKAIFGNVPTGYIDQKADTQSPDVKIVEVVKSLVSDKSVDKAA